jgi:hypothetical protein
VYATAFAGRAGLFASALRSAGEISIQRAQVFAQTEGCRCWTCAIGWCRGWNAAIS